MSFPTISLSKNIKDRALHEGIPFIQGSSQIVRFTGRTGTGGNQAGTISLRTVVKAAWIDCIVLSASEQCLLQILGPYLVAQGSTSTAVGNTTVQSAQILVGPGSVTIPINEFISLDRANMNVALISRIDQDPRHNIALAVNSGGASLTTSKSTNLSELTNSYSYTITVTNSSGSSATGTHTITETLPTGCRFISGSGTGWTIVESNGIVTCTSTTSIANNGTSTITLIVAPRSSTTISATAYGYQVDHDIFTDAPAVVWCGTSITAGSSPSMYSTSYPYLIRNWLREIKNIHTRIVNRAIPGSTSSHHEYLRNFNGRYTFNEPPLFAFWEHGVNDVAQTVPQGTTVANMQAFANHMLRLYPNIKVFVLAPYPNGTVNTESSLAALRTALSAGVASLNNSQVQFISGTGNMFNPVTEINTYTSDGTHLNDAGNALAASVITNFLNSNIT